MKKTYDRPEIEVVMLETEEPVTATLGIGSNILIRLAFEDEQEETMTVNL